MWKRWYIMHSSIEGDYGFFGPFKKRELNERLNDAYADFLASDADDLEAIKLSRKQVKELEFVAPRDVWVDQAKVMEEDPRRIFYVATSGGVYHAGWEDKDDEKAAEMAEQWPEEIYFYADPNFLWEKEDA